LRQDDPVGSALVAGRQWLSPVDGQGNGLVINPVTDPAYVVEMIRTVAQLSGNTFDLGEEDGINVVVTKF